MLVSEAAKQLGMNTQTLRLALQQQLFPFGVAVKTSENRFTYYINENQLENYLKGGLYGQSLLFDNHISTIDSINNHGNRTCN